MHCLPAQEFFVGEFVLGKNRDRLTIISDILQAATVGASKTRLMHEANLSYVLLEKYLSLAKNAGLVDFIDYKYRLTDDGRDFLRVCRQFEARYEKAQKDLESLSLEREELTKFFEGKNLVLLESVLCRREY